MGDVIDNKAESRFELAVDGSLAIAEYRVVGDTIYFTHTETPTALQGKGVASALVRGALTSAKERGFKIAPRCSFVANYIAKHPEFRS
ncbi:MAG TPA: GNAT family N-acetyltransferase [Rhodoblastus sp.]|nr:GNAT family N-acetyltransferase [Rhodoblastus sp.]